WRLGFAGAPAPGPGGHGLRGGAGGFAGMPALPKAVRGRFGVSPRAWVGGACGRAGGKVTASQMPFVPDVPTCAQSTIPIWRKILAVNRQCEPRECFEPARGRERATSSSQSAVDDRSSSVGPRCPACLRYRVGGSRVMLPARIVCVARHRPNFCCTKKGYGGGR